MNRSASLYKRHRFPPDIIRYAVWLYFRFNLSHRDIEELLAERGIAVSYKSILLWCIKFGPMYAKRLKDRHRGYGDTFFVDEVVRIARDVVAAVDEQDLLAGPANGTVGVQRAGKECQQ